MNSVYPAFFLIIKKGNFMRNLLAKQRTRLTGLTALILGLLTLNIGIAQAAGDTTLDKSVMDTLKTCQQISTSCMDTTKAATGILVFPNVVKADLIIGGAGGKGALIENGTITGYYNIGAASAGLQAGIESASQVYVFRTADALAKLKDGSEWKAGATADVALIEADANARGATGSVLAYVFDAKGLHAGVSLDVFRVWKAGQKRP
jgi:lipid-binding SYLF domain-containing protein